MLYISFNVSLENLVVHQSNIPQLMTFFILAICLLDNVSTSSVKRSDILTNPWDERFFNKLNLM